MTRSLPPLLLALALASPAASAQADAPSRAVLVNVADTSFGMRYSGQGFLMDATEARERQKAGIMHVNRYRLLKKYLEGVDVPAIIREAMHCLPGREPPGRCRDVVLVEGDSGATPSPADEAPGTVRVDVGYTEWRLGQRDRSFRVTVGIEGLADSGRLLFVFSQPTPSSLSGSPFPNYRNSPRSKAEQANYDYWFVGAPTRAETALRQALAEFRRVLERESDPAAGNPLRDKASLSALPKVSSLVTGDCKRACKAAVIGQADERIWYVEPSKESGITVQSVPLDFWNH